MMERRGYYSFFNSVSGLIAFILVAQVGTQSLTGDEVRQALANVVATSVATITNRDLQQSSNVSSNDITSYSSPVASSNVQAVPGDKHNVPAAPPPLELNHAPVARNAGQDVRIRGNNVAEPGHGCVWSELADTKGYDDYIFSYENGLALADCKVHCEAEPECQAVEFRQGSCILFNSIIGETLAEHTLATKVCSQSTNAASNCTLDHFPNMKGVDSNINSFEQGTTVEDCSRLCLADVDCQLVELRDGFCVIFSSTTAEYHQTSSVLIKRCGSDSETQATNPASTPTSTAATPLTPAAGTTASMAGAGDSATTATSAGLTPAGAIACDMTDHHNMTGAQAAVYSFKITSSFEECKTICKSDFECQATEFQAETGYCTFFNSNQGTPQAFTVLSTKTCGEGDKKTCQMDPFRDVRGLESNNYKNSSAATIDECNTRCLADSLCKATEIRSGTCLFFTSTDSSYSAGSVISTKACFKKAPEPEIAPFNPRPAKQMCDMEDAYDTSGNDRDVYSYKAGSSLELCKNACAEETMCQATELKGGYCAFYLVSTGFASQFSVLSRKNCHLNRERSVDNKPRCTFTVSLGYRGLPENVYSYYQSYSLEDCKTSCEVNKDCKATEFRRGYCLYYNTSDSVPTPEPNSAFALKSCPADISSKPCKTYRMEDALNTAGLNNAVYNYVSGKDLEACKNGCFGEIKCKATEFTNGFCAYYADVNGVPHLESVLSRKLCADEQSLPMRQCSMVNSENFRGRLSFNYKRSSGSNFDECKTRCEAEAECKAVEFRNSSECFFYNNDKAEMEIGSTLAQKVCSAPTKPQTTKCTMEDVKDTAGVAFYDYVNGTSFEECKTECYTRTKCQSTQFSGGYCVFYSTSKSQALVGSILSQKVCPTTGPSTSTPPGTGCVYNGIRHKNGAKFKDDCNTCWCFPDSSTYCTTMECETAAPVVEPVGATTPGTTRPTQAHVPIITERATTRPPVVRPTPSRATTRRPITPGSTAGRPTASRPSTSGTTGTRPTTSGTTATRPSTSGTTATRPTTSGTTATRPTSTGTTATRPTTSGTTATRPTTSVTTATRPTTSITTPSGQSTGSTPFTDIDPNVLAARMRELARQQQQQRQQQLMRQQQQRQLLERRKIQQQQLQRLRQQQQLRQQQLRQQQQLKLQRQRQWQQMTPRQRQMLKARYQRQQQLRLKQQQQQQKQQQQQPQQQKPQTTQQSQLSQKQQEQLKQQRLREQRVRQLQQQLTPQQLLALQQRRRMQYNKLQQQISLRKGQQQQQTNSNTQQQQQTGSISQQQQTSGNRYQQQQIGGNRISKQNLLRRQNNNLLTGTLMFDGMGMF